MKRAVVLTIIVLCSSLSVAVQALEISLPELRMTKRFGFGFSAAGPLSILGMEVDVNVTEEISIGGGIGTGLDYSTFMVKGRYFLLGKSVSPYFGAGFARWWTSRSIDKNIGPSVLVDEFLSESEDLSKGFSVYTFYPLIGVQFMHPMGLAVFAELHYLFKLFNFANGTYAGLGMHWYF